MVAETREVQRVLAVLLREREPVDEAPAALEGVHAFIHASVRFVIHPVARGRLICQGLECLERAELARKKR